MEIKVSIPKLNSLKKALREWPEVSAKEINDAIKKSIFKITEKTLPITPVDTHRLRSSIKEGISFGNLKGKIEPKVKYAKFVHEGTVKWPLSKPPRNPGTVRQFLKIGTEKSMDDIKHFFLKALENITSKTAKKV